MNQLTDKTVSFTGASRTGGRGADRDLMNFLVRALIKLGIRNEDFGYHLLRASMVIIFFFFGYQKWFQYEVERLIPYISNGPLIFWLYPALGCAAPLCFGRLGMDVRHAIVPGILEQEVGRPRGARLQCHLHRHRHDHPLHARRL